MPRYRFDWRNVDRELLADISADRVDPAGDPVDWLRQTYGARPRERFVAELWPTLRDRWLAGDDAAGARRAIVDALRSWSLGDLSIDVADEPGQLAYLRSCRNQVSLRRTVLDEFIRLGERPAEPLKPTTAPAVGWPEFEASLVDSLQALAVKQFLILSVRGTGVGGGDEEQGSAYFVQFANGGEEGFRIEAVSDAYLAGDDHLSKEQLGALVHLGWHMPTYAPGDQRGDADPHASPNWVLDYEGGGVDEGDAAPPFADIAALAVATLREVYGAATPAHLEYAAYTDDGTPVELPLAGVVAREQQRETAPAAPTDTELPRPTNQEELRAELRQTLLDYLEVAELEPDADGDFAIDAGSTVVYARALSEIPVIRFFAPILTNVRSSYSLVEAINEIGREYTLLRAVWDDDAVFLISEVVALPYVTEHVVHALSVITHFADELDDQLQQRFGGRTLRGPGVALTVREGDAGYL